MGVLGDETVGRIAAKLVALDARKDWRRLYTQDLAYAVLSGSRADLGSGRPFQDA